jgi:hypothetical protein
MHMKYALIVATIFVTLSACYTTDKAKKEMKTMFKHYEVTSNIDAVSDTPKKKVPKKVYRQQQRVIEHTIALKPDSVSMIGEYGIGSNGSPGFKPNTIDSFYRNPYKIAYIRKHRLQTAGKILLQE